MRCIVYEETAITEKNIDSVIKEIETMTKDEFDTFIDEHKNGDIAEAVIESKRN